MKLNHITVLNCVATTILFTIVKILLQTHLLTTKCLYYTTSCDHFCRMSQPLLIGELLKYFDPAASENADLKHAYLCASCLVLSMLISIFLSTLTYNAILRCAMNVRVACSSIIFRKVLYLQANYHIKYHVRTLYGPCNFC